MYDLSKHPDNDPVKFLQKRVVQVEKMYQRMGAWASKLNTQITILKEENMELDDENMELKKENVELKEENRLLTLERDEARDVARQRITSRGHCAYCNRYRKAGTDVCQKHLKERIDVLNIVAVKENA